jgi:hypothetical protein
MTKVNGCWKCKKSHAGYISILIRLPTRGVYCLCSSNNMIDGIYTGDNKVYVSKEFDYMLSQFYTG